MNSRPTKTKIPLTKKQIVQAILVWIAVGVTIYFGFFHDNSLKGDALPGSPRTDLLETAVLSQVPKSKEAAVKAALSEVLTKCGNISAIRHTRLIVQNCPDFSLNNSQSAGCIVLSPASQRCHARVLEYTRAAAASCVKPAWSRAATTSSGVGEWPTPTSLRLGWFAINKVASTQHPQSHFP